MHRLFVAIYDKQDKANTIARMSGLYTSYHEVRKFKRDGRPPFLRFIVPTDKLTKAAAVVAELEGRY